MKSSSRRSLLRSLENGRRRKSFLKVTQRRLHAEQLESRVLLAGDILHNFDDPFDTDKNGAFSPVDILHVINQLNAPASTASGEGTTTTYYNDVNADGYVSPIDALQAINEYNSRAEGEASKIVRFTVSAFDLGDPTQILNTTTNTLAKGTDYELRVVVKDLRLAGGTSGSPDGVFAGYLDLLYDKLKTNVEIEEQQTITFNNDPAGGTFTLTFNGQTTANITYTLSGGSPENTIATNIQNALDTRFGANKLLVTVVSAGDPTQFRVRFMGQFGDQDVAMMTANASGLTSSGTTPTITVSEFLKGIPTAVSQGGNSAFLESFRFSAQYPNQKRALDGQTSPFVDPNRIDEVGAFAGTSTLGSAAREIFRVRMNSNDGGLVAFTGSVASIIKPTDDTLVYGGLHDFAVAEDEIEIINATPFTITEPFSANADSYTFAETTTSPVRNLTVMTAGGGADTGTLTNVTISSISTTNLSVGTLAIAPGATSINFTQLPNVNNAGTPSTFTYTLRNSVTGVTDTATVTVNITAVNNAPVNTVPAAVQNIPEEVTTPITGISIADIDANETVGATLDVDLSVQHGIITLGTIPGSPSFTFVSGANGTAAMVIRGSIADLNTALGSLSYTSSLNYVGSDSLRIVTNDRGNTGGPAAGLSDTDTVTINVTPVNDAPTVNVPVVGSVLAGDPLTITGTSTDDVDVGASNLKVTLSVTTTNAPETHLTLGTTAGLTFTLGKENGKAIVEFTGTKTAVNNALASFTYTPAIDDGGDTQTITVLVNDQGNTGSGGPKSVSGLISVEVDPLSFPFARRDPTPSNPTSVAAFTVVENSSGNLLPVLLNDLVDAGNNPVLVSVNAAAHGTTAPGTLGDTGKVVYAPNATFWGTDTFTYVMFEDNPPPGPPVEVPSTGTVTVTITNVNDAPVAVDSSDSTNEDTAKDIVLSVSDVDDNNNVGFTSTLTPTVRTAPLHGTATVNANGTIRYTPALDYNGADSFAYTVSDGTLASGTATVTLNVVSVNDNPVAKNDAYSASEDVLLTVSAGTGVRNHLDGAETVDDNDNKDNNPVTNLTVELVSGPTHASSFNLAADGSFTYQGTQDFNGTDTFIYRLNDGGGVNNLSNNATVTINIAAVNDAPVANPDSYLTENETLLNANVSTAGNPRSTVRANDSDVDNTLASLTVSLEAGMGPSHATSFTLNADGSFTYTAPGTYTGPDSFVYRLTDPSGGFSTATVSITVTEKNDPPVAVNDSYDATEDVQLDVTTANGVRDGAGLDHDPDSNNPNNTLQVILVSPPTHSSVFVLNIDGSFSYKAAANYNGPDSFKYKLLDPFAAESNTATVSINVMEVNDNPTARDDGSPTARLTLIKNTTANPFVDQEINVLANDDNSPDFNIVENLTITSAGTAGVTLHGTVAISADLKKVLYTPTQDYEGPDQFSYTISDGRGGSATATVYIEVVNFIPTDITGTVFVDSNNNGVQDSGEKPLAGVKITLQGHDNIFNIDFGADTDNNATNNVAALVVYTDIDGHYRFDAPGSLRPGMRPGSYSITEEQPTFMRDGIDTAGNNAALIANDKMSMTLPLLGIAGGINGNNFGERGLDPSVVSISDILASSTGNGLILSINGSSQLWYTRLTGWTNLKSASVTLSGDTSSATFIFTDLQNNTYTRTISQVGNPRFRIMGRAADGSELIRLDGTAADFSLNLLAAGSQGPQPEGEADGAGYARSVDELMAAVGNA